MNVSVLIPYRPDGGERDTIWSWLHRRYQELLPGWEITVSDDKHQGPGFNRGQARNLAADLAHGDIFVIGDADTAFNRWDLVEAVADVAARGGWRVPYVYHQLSRESSLEVLQSDPGVLLTLGGNLEAEWTGVGTSVAPLIVVPAAVFRTVGGYDERYQGWGSDDAGLQVTLDTLYQPYERFQGASWHLWHSRSELHDSGARLTLDYQAAHGDKQAILKLREGHRL